MSCVEIASDSPLYQDCLRRARDAAKSVSGQIRITRSATGQRLRQCRICADVFVWDDVVVAGGQRPRIVCRACKKRHLL